jgi:serine/threonine protein kinase
MAHPEFVERFKREAKAAGRLRHPNVVNVTDFGFAQLNGEKVAYLAMEYLDGCTLGEVLSEEKRLPLSFVVDIIEQVCSAIEEAHQQGIVHRDLKPDNIWLEPNGRGGYTVKVLDFGLAKLGDAPPPRPTGQGALNLPDEICMVEKLFAKPNQHVADNQSTITQLPGSSGQAPAQLATASPPASLPGISAITAVQPADYAEARKISGAFDDEADTNILTNRATAGGRDPRTDVGVLTHVGAVLGTPIYMSPEQCRGEQLDARTDIYSLGVIMYQMLAGDPPFTGNSHTLISQHINARPRPLGEIRPDIPVSIAALIMSALSKNPAERPATAAAFANALRARSEGVGTLLRQAMALYSEHFPTFFRISLIGHIPLLIFSFSLLFHESVTYHLMPKPVAILISIVVWLGVTLSDFFAKAVNAAAFVPVVAQLLVTPLRPIEIKPIFIALKKRLKALTTAAIWYHVIWGLALCLCLIPGLLVAIKYALYSSVVMMEGLGGRAALKRSKVLVSRLKRNVISLLIINLMVGPILVAAVSALISDKITHLAKFTGDLLATGSTSTPVATLAGTIVGVFLGPLTAIAFAMLYFKTRQAGGETLREALGQFGEETPRSKWQLHMRERIRLRSRISGRITQ